MRFPFLVAALSGYWLTWQTQACVVWHTKANLLIFMKSYKPVHCSLAEDGRVRQSELVARIKQGTIAVQCEGVRDLSAFVAHEAAYGSQHSWRQIGRASCRER